MPVNIIGTLKPKNNGKFPVAEAVDIKVKDDLRLDKALENKAELSTVNFALAGKADNSDINSLQSQINEIITPVTQDAEVQNARVDTSGTSHTTLKERLDSDYTTLSGDISDLDEVINGEPVETQLSVASTNGIVKDVNGQIDYSGSTVYTSKMYTLPSGTSKIRVKTTAYDSDNYYKSAYYVYFANGLTVTGKYLSNYSSITSIDTVLDVPQNSNCVWVVSRIKESSADESEMTWINECYTVTYTSGLLDEVDDIEDDVAALSAGLTQLDNIVMHISDDQEMELEVPTTTGYYVDDGTTGYDWTQHLSPESGSTYTVSAYHIDSRHIGKTLKITVTGYGSESGRFFGFCDENNIIVKSYREKSAGWVHNADGTYSVELPIVSPYFFLSLASSSTIVSITATYNLINIQKTGYVSPSGSDSNDGTSMAVAFKTVNKALSIGCERVILAGGTYKQRIDLSESLGKRIEIESYDRSSRPVFYDSECAIVESATLSDGVYSATIDAEIETGNSWLYQEGVPDISTEITDAERLPVQRGKQYRCDDTRIIKCTATSTQDAIAEIKESSGYKWYLDSTTLYFSAPQAPSQSNPICMSKGRGLFSNADRSISLAINGIECKYLALNLKNLCDVSVADCKATNVYGYGAITYDNTLNAKFLRCEASRCCNATNGDGFNADVTNQGEAFAKHYTATFIDCWSHDNADDGYSDHRHAETTLIGGLFEYNGKAGVTPSYGCHCSCYNVYSRKNYSGYACVGPAQEAEGGKYTQMLCSNCVAESNDRGGEQAGFVVSGDGNKMILVNCKAINNYNSFTIGSTATATLIDCGSLGQTRIFNGSPENATVEATTLVTSAT